MAKTKISEFSTTAGNNTDINSINIAEGCAPSGINDAIRELMRQLKEFQTGGAGDSVNSGGDFSVATNKFTVASATGNTAVAGTLAVTGVATLTAQPILSSLTASKAVFTDGSKGLVSNDITGTGNVVMSNSPTLVTPALGTPASGVVTNLTGTASININGTVGATTPSTGAFTTLSSTGNTTLGDASGDTVTINGTATFVNANPTLSAGTANGVAYLNGSKVVTTGSALTFDGTNLGIGTSSPLTKLDVKFATNKHALFTASASYSNGADLIATDDSGTEIALGLAGSTVRFYTAAAEQMRLTSTGLGIGTSSPGEKLEVYGNTSGGVVAKVNNANASGYSQIQMTNSGTSGRTYLLGVGGNTAASGFANNFTVYDVTAAATRLTLDSSGNLLVGTTSSNNGRMDVEAQTAGVAISFRRNTGVYGSNTVVGNISCDGSSTAYATSSDYRLKENIAPMTGALAKVDQLNPVSYTWKADGSAGQGFIAHELQAVVPDCVTGEKDAVDSEGNPVYQGIDTSFLVATLTAAIKEQQAIIQQLTARVAALES